MSLMYLGGHIYVVNVQIDIDGDGKADMSINIDGIVNFVAGDFLL